MHNTPIMSLDNFFAHTGLMKKKDGHKKGGRGNANANATHASHDNELDPEGEVAHKANLTDDEEPNVHRDKLIVESVTASIEKMLDSKLANIIKPFNEVSGKLDSVIERMGTVEERVSDLEDVSAATAPRVGALEVQLKKALDRLENLENQTRRQNIRIIGLKEGAERKTPVDIFEKWIPDVLNMPKDRIKIERAHRTGPPLRVDVKEGPRAVLVRLHNYTDKQRIL